MAEPEQRTEVATPKRRRDAREKGQVARSQEINTTAMLLAGLLALCLGGPAICDRMMEFMRHCFASARTVALDPASTVTAFTAARTQYLAMTGPIFAVLVVGALLASLGQVGVVLTPNAILPNLEKLNPINGIKRLVSLSGLVRVSIAIAKFAVIGWVSVASIEGSFRKLMGLAGCEPGKLLVATAQETVLLTAKIVAALIVIAILDYVYQRWKHERDIRMSKEEVREEQKQHEGNPTIKGRIRAVQREMSLRRMMHDVPTADVVVRNPTHFAVALKYDRATMAAPTAVAKGADLIAKRIIAVAEENEVAVIEDKPVARALYSTVEIGQQIPPELYRAVARILAHVYQLRGIAV